MFKFTSTIDRGQNNGGTGEYYPLKNIPLLNEPGTFKMYSRLVFTPGGGDLFTNAFPLI